VGTVVAAGLWDRVKALSSHEASRLLEGARPPGRAREIERIRTLFGERAEGIIRSQRRFLTLEGHIWEDLVKRMIDNWDRIQSIAAVVPDVGTTVSLLVRAGCPTTPRELGLGADEVERALVGAHWLRDRFTIGKLSRMLFGEYACQTHFGRLMD
jgi:glycerol-1-phosphate dehydrogenase [NAD(P)+]